MQITLIHFSDFHFRDNEKENFLFKRIKELASAVNSNIITDKVVFFVISGDVVFSGKESEYLIAEIFFRELEKSINHDKEIHYVLVPGNHDCDFTSVQSIRKTLIDAIKNGQKNFEPEVIEKCLEPQSAFRAFSHKITKQSAKNEISLTTKMCFEIDGKIIAFYLLNTAWISQIEDKKELYFPVEDLSLFIQEENDDLGKYDIVISMLHHPCSWFNDNDSRKIMNFLEKESDLVLTGHEHESDSYEKIKRNGDRVEYIEGGVMQGKSPEKSQFNIIKLNCEEKSIEVSSCSWDTPNKVYRNDENPTKGRFFRNQNRSSSGKLLQDVFEKKLNDLGIAFAHPTAETIILDDVYVFPHLRKHSTAGNQQIDKTIIRERIPDFLSDNQYTIIIGAEKSGKTSLAKKLFKHFFDSDYYPLLFDGNQVKNCDDTRIKTLLGKKINDIYRNPVDLDKYLQVEKTKRVIIIDDFNKSTLNKKGRERFISIIKEFFSTIIILGNEQLTLNEYFIEADEDSTISDFVICEILGMGHLKRSEIIKKWYMLGQDKYTVEEQDFSKSIIKAEKLLTSLLGNNYFPPYPFFILAILQHIETGTPVNTSSGSLGYLYEVLLTSSLSKMKEPKLDTLYSYLSELAFHFFVEKYTSISEEKFRIWHNYYCEKFKLTIDFHVIIDGLITLAIFKNESFGYGFRYPYIYYYFVGRYLRDHLNESDVKDLVKKMCERLHQTASANIIIFLCHLSKDPFILETLLIKSKNLFSKYTEFDVFTGTAFLSKLLSEIPKLVLSEENLEVNQEKEFEKQDEIEEENSNDLTEDDCDLSQQSDFDLDEFMQINVALKNLQILGQLLKNYPGSWQGEQKFDLVQECYSLGLRILQYMIKSVEDNKEEIIEKFKELLHKQKPNWNSEKIYQGINNLVFGLVESMTYLVIKQVADSVGHQDFSLTFEDLLSKNQGKISYQFIDLSVKLDNYKQFPKTEIEKLAKLVYKNLFSHFLLKHLVWYHFYLYKTDYTIKLSICKRLGIEFKPQLGRGR